MGNITTVIFDIGNVLVTYNYKKYLKDIGFNEEDVALLAQNIFETDVWVDRDRGGKTDDQYRRMFIERSPHLEEKINKAYEKILDIAVVCDYSKNWLKSLKDKGIKVYLLSNYSEHSFLHDIKRFDFAQYVDGMVISYEINKIKPEPEIYHALMEKYNIKPEEAVFIDDLQKNIDAFAKLGGNTILMTGYEKAVEELATLGV